LAVNIDISHVNRAELFVSWRAIDFLIEAVQGPCVKNQDILIGHERFVSTLARWSSSKVSIEASALAQYGTGSLNMTVRANDSSLFNSVDFFALKVMKNKCLILRCSLLEGRTLRDNWSSLRSMHEKHKQEGDTRLQLQSIYNEYRTVKKLGRQLMLPPARGRMVYRLIRSEAHLILTYYTALKRWFPSVMDAVIPVSLEPVRRKQIGSEAEYVEAQREYKKNERYKRVYSSYMDRQRNIEVFWAEKGLFQISFQKPREVISSFCTV
jgi:hypothetical protein